MASLLQYQCDYVISRSSVMIDSEVPNTGACGPLSVSLTVTKVLGHTTNTADCGREDGSSNARAVQPGGGQADTDCERIRQVSEQADD